MTSSSQSIPTHFINSDSTQSRHAPVSPLLVPCRLNTQKKSAGRKTSTLTKKQAPAPSLNKSRSVTGKTLLKKKPLITQIDTDRSGSMTRRSLSSTRLTAIPQQQPAKSTKSQTSSTVSRPRKKKLINSKSGAVPTKKSHFQSIDVYGKMYNVVQGIGKNTHY